MYYTTKKNIDQLRITRQKKNIDQLLDVLLLVAVVYVHHG